MRQMASWCPKRAGRHWPPGRLSLVVGCTSVKSCGDLGEGSGWASNVMWEFWERRIREMRLGKLGEGMAG